MKNLIIVLVIIFLLIFGWWYFAARTNPGATMDHGNMMQNKGGASTMAEELVECPITGNKIYPSQAYAKTEYKGKTYYFCCAGCPEEFGNNPSKYAK